MSIDSSASSIQNSSRRLRVALCMEYPLRQWGGVEVLVKELLGGLSETCDLLLASDDTPETLRESESSRFVTAHFPWNPQSPARQLAESYSRWLLEQKADVVHFHLGGTYALRTRSWTGSPVPRVAQTGIPCVATNHGAFSLLDFCAPWRPLSVRLALLPGFWLGRSHTLRSLRREVTVSDHDLQNMRRWFFPFRSKFQRIYHSQLEGNEPIEEKREPTILCLGTVGPRKGQPYLVEAFARIAADFPDWNLIIAGRMDAGASEARQMDDSIRRNGLQARVQLRGAVSVEEAHSLMRSCGIFAMPSLAEGLGLSLQEALFCGAPAVASRVGGIQDMVVDGSNGLLSNPADVDSLSSALARAIRSPSDRLQWGRNARRRLEVLGMNRHSMIQHHRDLYESVVATCQRRG